MCDTLLRTIGSRINCYAEHHRQLSCSIYSLCAIHRRRRRRRVFASPIRY